ncbi:MAG: hypothetical protein GY754_43070 [bacterium]|nr:hypothetical protein [bacterium]
MVEPDITLKIIVVTEDSSKDSFGVLKNIINSILKNTTENFQSQVLEYEYPDKHTDVMNGNRWQEKRPREFSKKITDFKRQITSYLMEEYTYIFWHFDGDQKWKDSKEGARCTHISKFQKFFGPISEQVSGAMEKVLFITPFYSIESWLYQNTQKLKKLKEKTDDIQKTAPWILMK